MRRTFAMESRLALTGEEFILDHRRRHDSRSPQRGEGVAGNEGAMLDLGLVRSERQKAVEGKLANDVARTIARLAQIEELLEAHQGAVLVRPAAGRPAGMELARLGQPDLVGLDPKRSHAARGTIGEHDPDQLAAM